MAAVKATMIGAGGGWTSSARRHTSVISSTPSSMADETVNSPTYQNPGTLFGAEILTSAEPEGWSQTLLLHNNPVAPPKRAAKAMVCASVRLLTKSMMPRPLPIRASSASSPLSHSGCSLATLV
jgi:hypothetical protein